MRNKLLFGSVLVLLLVIISSIALSQVENPLVKTVLTSVTTPQSDIIEIETQLTDVENMPLEAKQVDLYIDDNLQDSQITDVDGKALFQWTEFGTHEMSLLFEGDEEFASSSQIGTLTLEETSTQNIPEIEVIYPDEELSHLITVENFNVFTLPSLDTGCTPNWVELQTDCRHDNTISHFYVDSNDCYARTNDPSHNNPPSPTTSQCQFDANQLQASLDSLDSTAHAWEISRQDYISNYLEYSLEYIQGNFYRVQWQWKDEFVKEVFQRCNPEDNFDICLTKLGVDKETYKVDEAELYPKVTNMPAPSCEDNNGEVTCAPEVEIEQFPPRTYLNLYQAEDFANHYFTKDWTQLKQDLLQVKNQGMPFEVLQGQAQMVGSFNPTIQDSGSFVLEIESEQTEVKIGPGSVVIVFNQFLPFGSIHIGPTADPVYRIVVNRFANVSSATFDITGTMDVPINMGDGSDGELIFTNSATSLGNLIQGQDYTVNGNTIYLNMDQEYQFTNINLGTGKTLSTQDTTGNTMIIRAQNGVTISGDVDLSGVLVSGANGVGRSGSGETSGYGASGRGGGTNCDYRPNNGGNNVGGGTPFGQAGASVDLSGGNGLRRQDGSSANGFSAGGAGSALAELGGYGCSVNVRSGAGGNSYGADGQDGSVQLSHGGSWQCTWCLDAGGGGGAGGVAGSPGGNLGFYAKNVLLSGNIDLSGSAGGNGGNGGKRITHNGPFGEGGQGGHGGGGGNSGNLYISSLYLVDSSTRLLQSGLAGIGGQRWFQQNNAWQNSGNNGYYGLPGVANFANSSYPSNPFIEVGTADGSYEWSYQNTFNITQTVPDFAQEINQALNNGACDCVGCQLQQHLCLVPVTFHSDTLGRLDFSNIQVTYSNFPRDPSLDAANDLSVNWNHTGEFQGVATTTDFSQDLQNYLNDDVLCPPSQTTCQVPIVLSSASSGVLNISNLNIQYQYDDLTAPIINSLDYPDPIMVGSSFPLTANISDETPLLGNVELVIYAKPYSLGSIFSPSSTNDIYLGSGWFSSNPGRYSGRLTATNINGLTSTRNFTFNFVSPEADLNAQNIQVNTLYEGASSTLNVTVFNYGLANAQNVMVSLFVNNAVISNQTTTVAGQSNQLIQFAFTPNVGQNNVTISIDPTNQIPESNEANNILTTTLWALDQTPPTINQATATNVIEGNPTFISVDAVDNVGVVAVTAQVAGNNVNLQLNPTTNLYEGTVLLQAGQYSIDIIVEDVNGLRSSRQILAEVFSQTPDLIVSAMNFQPLPVTDNVVNTITVFVEKNGGSSYTTQATLFVDGNQTQSQTVSLTSQVSTIPFTWAATAGAHNVTIEIDSANSVLESDETNNQLTIPITVQDGTRPVIHQIIAPNRVVAGTSFQIGVNTTDNVEVAQVNAGLSSQDQSLVLNNGLYEGTLVAPQSGVYHITVTATDSSGLQTQRTKQLIVQSNLADLSLDAFDVINLGQNLNQLQTQVTVHNNGFTDASGTIIRLNYGNGFSEQTVDIAQQSSQTLTFVWNATTYGDQQMTVTADFPDLITESDEGNNEVTKEVTVLDLEGPVAPTVNAAPFNWTTQTTHQVSWTTVTDLSGISHYEYSIDGGVWTSVGTATSVTTPSQTDGTHLIAVRAVDNFGNLGEVGTTNLFIDTLPPNPIFLQEWHSGSEWTTHDSPYYTWDHPGDAGSGIQTYFLSGNSVSTPIEENYFHPTHPSGIYDLSVIAIDFLNHQTFSNVVTVKIDKENPSTPTITSNSHPDDQMWYSNNIVEISANATDNHSGIAGYHYVTDTFTNTVPGRMNRFSNAGSFNLSSVGAFTNQSQAVFPDGQWNVHVVAVDEVGLFSSASTYHFKVDSKAPVAPTLTVSPPTWTTQSTVQVSWDSINDLSGVNYYEYAIDAGTWTSVGSTTTLTTPTLTSGVHNISVRAIDNAGNVGAIAQASIYIDTTAPAAPDVVINPNTWTNQNSHALTWSAVTDASGISHYEYQVGSSAPINASLNQSATITVPEGTHIVSVYAVDTAGNQGGIGFVTAQVDQTPPPSPTLNTAHTTWTPVQVHTVTWSDPVDASGISSYEYRVDGAAWQAITIREATTQTLAHGIHTMEVRAIDNAGNVGPASNISLYVDLQGPAAPMVQSDPNSPTNNDQPRIYWQALNDVSGIAEYEYSVDGNPWVIVGTQTEFYPQFNLPDGITNIGVRAIDNSGNTGAIGNLDVTIDTTPPNAVTFGTLYPEWTQQTQFDVIWNVLADSINYYEYRVDSNPWQSVIGKSFSTSSLSDGVHPVEVRAIDAAGNIGQIASQDLKVDTTAPGTPSLTTAYTNWINIQQHTVSWSPISDLSGIKYYEYRTNGGSWQQTLLTSIGINLGQGTHLIEVRAVDNALNEGNIASIQLFVDLTPPTISNYGPAGQVTTTQPLIEAQFSDLLSGIDVGNVMLKLDGNIVTSSATITPSGISYTPSPLFGGYHDVALIIHDEAGNQAIQDWTFKSPFGE